jgi:HEAT repeat protein
MSDRLQPKFTGNAVADMETAKWLISHAGQLDIPAFMELAGDQRQPQWARIAAIYTLGMADDRYESASALVQILDDDADDEQVRAHAAEALGQMYAPEAVAVMDRVLTKGPPEVQHWTRYALTEMDTATARQVLQRHPER